MGQVGRMGQLSGGRAVPEMHTEEHRTRRNYIRGLIALTVVVVVVDVGAALLQIVSNARTNTARQSVTAGLNYEANMSLVMQFTLDAETGQRGYLLTGEPSYLDPARTAVRQAPAVLR